MAFPLADRVDVNDHGTIVFEGASAALSAEGMRIRSEWRRRQA